jgi:hypothetical protein
VRVRVKLGSGVRGYALRVTLHPKSDPYLLGLPRGGRLAAYARMKKARVPENPRPGSDLLYGVGSVYEPP